MEPAGERREQPVDPCAQTITDLLPQRSPPLNSGSTLVTPALILDITQPQWSLAVEQRKHLQDGGHALSDQVAAMELRPLLVPPGEPGGPGQLRPGHGEAPTGPVPW